MAASPAARAAATTSAGAGGPSDAVEWGCRSTNPLTPRRAQQSAAPSRAPPSGCVPRFRRRRARLRRAEQAHQVAIPELRERRLPRPRALGRVARHTDLALLARPVNEDE